MVGSSRRVEIYTDVVIKYARKAVGIRANKREVARFEAYNSRYFCPILAYASDYHFVVMKKAQIPSLRKRLLYARYLRMMLHSYRINDIHWYNVGELNGRAVIFDYADSWFSFRGWLNPLNKKLRSDL